MHCTNIHDIVVIAAPVIKDQDAAAAVAAINPVACAASTHTNGDESCVNGRRTIVAAADMGIVY